MFIFFVVKMREGGISLQCVAVNVKYDEKSFELEKNLQHLLFGFCELLNIFFPQGPEIDLTMATVLHDNCPG